MIMSFGKYRGKPLEEIPLSYLAWVHANCENASPYLREEIRRILSAEMKSQWSRPDTRCSSGLVGQWYRQLSREFHPDKGGSHEGMKAVNRGRELMLRLIGERT